MTNFEKLCADGKPIFLTYDQEEIVRRFSLRADGQYLYVTYLGEELRIDRHTGDTLHADGSAVDGAVMLAVFDYLCKKSDPPPLTGKKYPTATLPGYGTSRPDATTLNAAQAERMNGRSAQVQRILRDMGGEDFPIGDAAATFELFPGFPLVFQFWEGDEEFPPSVRFLWDERTADYFRFETLFYMMGGFLRQVLERLPQ